MHTVISEAGMSNSGSKNPASVSFKLVPGLEPQEPRAKHMAHAETRSHAAKVGHIKARRCSQGQHTAASALSKAGANELRRHPASSLPPNNNTAIWQARLRTVQNPFSAKRVTQSQKSARNASTMEKQEDDEPEIGLVKGKREKISCNFGATLRCLTTRRTATCYNFG